MAVDRRKQVIEAAEKSFAMFGYKATTMDGVAKIASVGKGTIYTFFANKEELFQEIMNRLIHELRRATEETVKEELAFFDYLNEVLEHVLDFREEHELALKLSQEVREIGTPMALDGLRQLEHAIVHYIAQKVQEAVDKEQIRACEPELTAFVMLKLYMSLTVEWQKSHNPLSKNEVAKRIRFYLEEGLLLRS
ncbi:TetR/AcrR family transcriptional regulator [Paenibacillus sp. HB172176]|uniref:TetR/AcrR family transcriptional regulator n=1 Tax=Paenibacillus sp. HB172176 TaxID=2493690 RepID=UPI00143C997D|nr:TetR/AcrR family transcriptional regulator [Paenibacillus sp. HB172176]